MRNEYNEGNRTESQQSSGESAIEERRKKNSGQTFQPFSKTIQQNKTWPKRKSPPPSDCPNVRDKNVRLASPRVPRRSRTAYRSFLGATTHCVDCRV